MNLLAKFCSLFLIIAVLGCSAKIENAESNILTGKLAGSKISELKVNIPVGWFQVDNDEYAHLDIWLMKNDYSASITFVPVIPDDETKAAFIGDEIKQVLRYSRILNKTSLGEDFKLLGTEKYYSLGDRNIGEYKFLNKNNLVQVYIIKYHAKYFEISASEIKSISKEIKNPSLAEITKTMIGSMK